jgi:hypothetical protein
MVLRGTSLLEKTLEATSPMVSDDYNFVMAALQVLYASRKSLLHDGHPTTRFLALRIPTLH